MNDVRPPYDPEQWTLLQAEIANLRTRLAHAERTVEVRAEQQRGLAHLGMVALQESDIQRVLEHAVNGVARTLGVPLCKVLQLQPDGQSLLLRAGVGWHEGLVGRATVSAGAHSHGGYTLYAEEPVIVDDLRTESRFDAATLLHDHGVISGVSCIISGGDRPWGVIGAHSAQHHQFTRDDVAFLQGVANVLAASLQRWSTISALIDTEKARRESEARFRALADNIAQLAWMSDGAGNIVWYNRRWFDYTGTTFEEMKGWGWRAVHHPDHIDRVVAKFQQHLESGEPWEDIFPLQSAGGEFRWFLSRAIPIKNEAGHVVRWFGTNTDVTEQRDAEEALRQSDRRKDEFIAVLAHELRNPLAPVRNAVEILRRIGQTDPKLIRARDIIDRQVTHMARLIDDLLDISRIARNKLALQKQRCDIAAIARQTAEDYRPNFEASGLQLLVVDYPGPVWVQGDPVRLAQMIGNLLNNAGRFTDRQGTVEVRVDVDEDRRCAQVRVIDDGVGIDPRLLPRLFDPFSQADQDLARSKGGLGLGLALTKGLAELHDGQVLASSEGIGKGATFQIGLPLSTEHTIQKPWNRPEQRGQALRILIIEDNRDAAETLGDLLELGGHDVRVVFDGHTALDIVHEFQPNVVISDIGLPGGMDGYELARKLRSDPVFSRIRLVALSGYANDEARRRSREAGFDVHLAKPPDISTLEGALVSR